MVFISSFFKKLVKSKDDSSKKKKKMNSIIQENMDPFTLWNNVGELGDGAFGKVFKAEHKESGQLAALKQVALETEEDLQDLMVEIDILTECKHPNIVGLFEAYLYQDKLWMYLEFCGGGAVDSLMHELEKPLTEPQIRFVGHEMCAALSFLHAHHVIHRDLKAGNVLVTLEGSVKLADFGVSAKMKEEKERRDTYIGTPYWMAPEVIACEMFKDAPYDERADIWSFGVTLIEFAEMKPPNNEMHPMRVGIKIQKSPPPKLTKAAKHSSPEFHNLLTKCLTKLPDSRLSAERLMQEPFFRNVTPEDNLYLRQLIFEAKAEVIETLEEGDPNKSTAGDKDDDSASRQSVVSFDESDEEITDLDDHKSHKPRLSEVTEPDVLSIVDDLLTAVFNAPSSDGCSIMGVVLDVKQEALSEIYASAEATIQTPSEDIAKVIRECDRLEENGAEHVEEGEAGRKKEEKEKVEEEGEEEKIEDVGAEKEKEVVEKDEEAEEKEKVVEEEEEKEEEKVKVEEKEEEEEKEKVEEKEEKDEKERVEEEEEEKEEEKVKVEEKEEEEEEKEKVEEKEEEEEKEKVEEKQEKEEKEKVEEEGEEEEVEDAGEDRIHREKTEQREEETREGGESEGKDTKEEGKEIEGGAMKIEKEEEKKIEDGDQAMGEDEEKVEVSQAEDTVQEEEEEETKEETVESEEEEVKEERISRGGQEIKEEEKERVDISGGKGKDTQEQKEAQEREIEREEKEEGMGEEGVKVMEGEKEEEETKGEERDAKTEEDKEGEEKVTEEKKEEETEKKEEEPKLKEEKEKEEVEVVGEEKDEAKEEKETEEKENEDIRVVEGEESEEQEEEEEEKGARGFSPKVRPRGDETKKDDVSDAVVRRRRNKLSESAEPAKEFKTLKKVRKFTIDGKEYTTTTKRRVAAGEDGSRRHQEFLQRKMAMREVKRLQILEQRQNRELLARQDAQRDELEFRLRQEEMTLQRNQEQEYESLKRHHRVVLDKMEAQHNSQVKLSSRRIKVDQEREVRRFKEGLKTEAKMVKHEVDGLPKERRKEEYKRRMDSKDEEFQTREKKFQNDLLDRLNTELQRQQTKNAEAIDALENECLSECHDKRKQHEEARAELNRRHLQMRHAQCREHQQELFALKRQQNEARQALERSLLQRALAEEEADLIAAHERDLKVLPKLKQRDMKVRQEIYRQSLLIPGRTCAPTEEKDLIRAFEESEVARVRKELEQAERRYKRMQQTLALQHQLHLAELEEIHSEKQKQLVDQESLKMGQLMDTCKKQLEAKEDELAARRKFLLEELQVEEKDRGSSIRQRSNSLASMRSFRGSIFS